MFCALNGATDTPRRRSHAQMAVVIQLLPAFEDVPPTNSDRAFIVATAERPSAPSRDLPNQPHGVSLVQLRQTHAGRTHRGSQLLRIARRSPGFLGVDDEGRAVQRSRRDERIGPRVGASKRHVGVSVRDQDRDRVVRHVTRRQLERVSEGRSAACR